MDHNLYCLRHMRYMFGNTNDDDDDSLDVGARSFLSIHGLCTLVMKIQTHTTRVRSVF